MCELNKYILDRLFEKIAWDACALEEVSDNADGNTPLVDRSSQGYKEASAVANTKVPVRLLMLTMMHLILDDHEECLKSIYRMFKLYECYLNRK